MTFKKGRFNVKTPPRTGVTPRRTPPRVGVTPRRTPPRTGVTPRRTPRQFAVSNNLTVTAEESKMLKYLKSKKVTTLKDLEYMYSKCEKAVRIIKSREKTALSLGSNIHGRKIRK